MSVCNVIFTSQKSKTNEFLNSFRTDRSCELQSKMLWSLGSWWQISAYLHHLAGNWLDTFTKRSTTCLTIENSKFHHQELLGLLLHKEQGEDIQCPVLRDEFGRQSDSQEMQKGAEIHGTCSSQGDRDADLSPCDFAATHCPQETSMRISLWLRDHLFSTWCSVFKSPCKFMTHEMEDTIQSTD